MLKKTVSENTALPAQEKTSRVQPTQKQLFWILLLMTLIVCVYTSAAATI
jgi:hypothetical protein